MWKIRTVQKNNIIGNNMYNFCSFGSYWCNCSSLVFCFLLLFVSGRQTVLVHQQTGHAAITVTALAYQVSHLTAAKVPSPVSVYIYQISTLTFLAPCFIYCEVERSMYLLMFHMLDFLFLTVWALDACLSHAGAPAGGRCKGFSWLSDDIQPSKRACKTLCGLVISFVSVIFYLGWFHYLLFYIEKVLS